MSPQPRPIPVTAPPSRPAVDEWGFYDPEQAGLAALFDRVAEKQSPESDADRMAASMREANWLSGANPALESRPEDDDQTPIRGSGPFLQ